MMNPFVVRDMFAALSQRSVSTLVSLALLHLSVAMMLTVLKISVLVSLPLTRVYSVTLKMALLALLLPFATLRLTYALILDTNVMSLSGKLLSMVSDTSRSKSNLLSSFTF